MEDCGRKSLELSINRSKVDVGGGFVSSASPRVFESKKAKRRPRLILSDSESGEDSLLLDRNVEIDIRRTSVESSEIENKKRKINGFVSHSDGVGGAIERKNTSKFVKFVHGMSACSNNDMELKNMHKNKCGVVGSDEAVRLQGKNGVLKLILNKNVKNVASMEHKNNRKTVIGIQSSSSICNPNEIRVLEKPNPPLYENRQKIHFKPLPELNSEGSSRHKHSVDGHLTRMISNGRQQGIISREKPLTKDRRQQKTKNSNSTEKQILREQIQKMLLDGGWRIDHRPRRNRDYLDSVYVSPSGTSYWSIIKAYDAFQKLSESELSTSKSNGDCIVFTPISKEVLSKLTRKTRKKMEKEMKITGICRKKDNAKHASPLLHENNENDGDVKKSCEKSKKFDSCESEKHMIEKLLFEPKHDHTIKNKRCTLVIRKSNKNPNSDMESDHFIPYNGKRTIISWLVDSGTVKLCEKVQYMNRKRSRVMLEGWITKDGIHCGCCSKILSVLKFEIHAGSKVRQPFQNIFVRSGVSLMKCQLEAWNRQDESKRSGFRFLDNDGDDPNDDTCGLCGDGGDLICCDGCPSTFHQSCLHMQVLPPGEWNCSNCSCKFCGTLKWDSTKGDGQTRSKLQKCTFCSKKYHDSCISNSEKATDDTDAYTFCGQNCQQLHETIHKALGVKHELDGGFSWSIIHRSDLNLDCSSRGFPLRVECNSKLAIALTIMDECFLPIVDRRSGVNFIHHVVYNCGANFSRLDCCGFYTFILERGDEILSAASVRIHGTELAEMPFIGTRHMYRRQGMCRLLLRTIEIALCSFNVKRLIIPAIADLTQTWTTVFGFSPLKDEHRNYITSLNVLVFPEVDILQKPLLHNPDPALTP